MDFPVFVESMINSRYKRNVTYVAVKSNASEPLEVCCRFQHGCPFVILLFNLAIEQILTTNSKM